MRREYVLLVIIYVSDDLVIIYLRTAVLQVTSGKLLCVYLNISPLFLYATMESVDAFVIPCHEGGVSIPNPSSWCSN
jgi:hypothetical protein